MSFVSEVITASERGLQLSIEESDALDRCARADIRGKAKSERDVRALEHAMERYSEFEPQDPVGCHCRKSADGWFSPTSCCEYCQVDIGMGL